MTARFQLLTPHSGHTLFGKNIKANGATIQPGLIVKLDSSGSTVSLCANDETPLGFAYGARYGVYRPESAIYADGEALTVIVGRGWALLSSDFFSTGSLPATSPDDLYAGDDGKIALSGTTKIGKYVRTETLVQPVAGTGTNQSLALIEFDFAV